MHLRNILLAVGVLALLTGALLAILWLTQGPAKIAAPQPASAPPSQSANAILIATHSIRSGTLLRPEDVTWKEVPAVEMRPANIAREPGAQTNYLGALTKKEFAGGDPILAGALLKPADRGFLAALLSPGMRAVSIAVEATQSAAGLLLPDDRVDIILTQTFGEDSEPGRKSVGETILRDLRVIALDQHLGNETPLVAATTKLVSRDSAVPKTITLEVTERQAEALAVASRLGRLDVAVRALERQDVEGGDDKTTVSSLWASEVSPALKTNRRPSAPTAATVSAPARSAPAAAAQIARQPVEVMHGSKTETR